MLLDPIEADLLSDEYGLDEVEAAAGGQDLAFDAQPEDVGAIVVEAAAGARKTLIVEPALLALFRTDAWRTGESKPRDRLRRQPTHDASRHDLAPHDPPRPRPDRPSRHRPETHKADPGIARSGGSGAVPYAPEQAAAGPTQATPLPAAGGPPTLPKRGFWRRIARLFELARN